MLSDKQKQYVRDHSEDYAISTLAVRTSTSKYDVLQFMMEENIPFRGRHKPAQKKEKPKVAEGMFDPDDKRNYFI